MTTGPKRGAAAPTLHLSVQYAVSASPLPRWRLRRWIQRALDDGIQHVNMDTEPIKTVSLTVRLVDEDEGRKLNHTWRQRDYATNVLTFAYGVDPGGTLHADIVICMPVLCREAAAQGKPVLHHAAHLTIHGVLHALGFDHQNEQDAHQMESLETALLARLEIPDPYAHDQRDAPDKT